MILESPEVEVFGRTPEVAEAVIAVEEALKSRLGVIYALSAAVDECGEILGWFQTEKLLENLMQAVRDEAVEGRRRRARMESIAELCNPGLALEELSGLAK